MVEGFVQLFGLLFQLREIGEFQRALPIGVDRRCTLQAINKLPGPVCLVLVQQQRAYRKS